MERAQASTSGDGKEVKQSATQQRGAAAAATRTDWCSDCWALAQDACRGAHRLVDFTVAEEYVAAEMSDAQREMDQAVLRIDQVHLRMYTLSEAVLRSAPDLRVQPKKRKHLNKRQRQKRLRMSEAAQAPDQDPAAPQAQGVAQDQADPQDQAAAQDLAVPNFEALRQIEQRVSAETSLSTQGGNGN